MHEGGKGKKGWDKTPKGYGAWTKDKRQDLVVPVLEGPTEEEQKGAVTKQILNKLMKFFEGKKSSLKQTKVTKEKNR